jgi:hypothetical protein
LKPQTVELSRTHPPLLQLRPAQQTRQAEIYGPLRNVARAGLAEKAVWQGPVAPRCEQLLPTGLHTPGTYRLKLSTPGGWLPQLAHFKLQIPKLESQLEGLPQELMEELRSRVTRSQGRWLAQAEDVTSVLTARVASVPAASFFWLLLLLALTVELSCLLYLGRNA